MHVKNVAQCLAGALQACESFGCEAQENVKMMLESWEWTVSRGQLWGLCICQGEKKTKKNREKGSGVLSPRVMIVNYVHFQL